MKNDSKTKIKYPKLRGAQMNLINIVFKKGKGRNEQKKKINKLLGKTNCSLSKTKYESIQKSGNNINYNESNLIDYFEKKKHLSFYKGANISVSSIILDTNKTTYNTNNIKNIKNSSISIRNIKKIKKIMGPNDISYNINNNNSNDQSLEQKKKNKEEIKSTINPYLDISKLTYKTDITSIRNKFSLLFSKEYDLFDKFIPSLYTLRLEPDMKENLSQLHNNSLSCIKYLSNLFDGNNLLLK